MAMGENSDRFGGKTVVFLTMNWKVCSKRFGSYTYGMRLHTVTSIQFIG